MANNVYEEDTGSQVGSHRRVYGSSRSRTLGEPAALRKAWSEYDWPMEQAVNGADVKANIVLTQVAAPATSDPGEMYEESFMLMECDSGAQRCFFHALV